MDGGLRCCRRCCCCQWFTNGQRLQEAAEGAKANGATPDTVQKHHPTLLRMLATQLGCQVADIVDFELNVCDTQPGTLGGTLTMR